MSFELIGRLPTNGASSAFQNVADETRALEELGIGAAYSRESNGDVFLSMAIAARESTRIELGTAVAIAFARSPMMTAYAAHELQVASRGRFVLGLGTQVRAHVERRFSMPFSPPARRMAEYIGAVREIWRSWRDQDDVRFEGDFYRHTLMTPAFRPEPTGAPDPVIMLAAVGPRMLDVAARSADGLFLHPFSGSDYLRERSLPRLSTSLADAGRDASGFRVAGSVIVGTGTTPDELAAARAQVRARVAFYASTPSYQDVLDFYDLSEVAGHLQELARSGSADRWVQMADYIPDELVENIAIVAPLDQLGEEVRARYSGLVDQLSLALPDSATRPLRLAALESVLRAGCQRV